MGDLVGGGSAKAGEGIANRGDLARGVEGVELAGWLVGRLAQLARAELLHS